MGCWYTHVCTYYLHVKFTPAAGVNLEKLVCSLFRSVSLYARDYILLYSHTLRGCPCPEHDKSVHSLLASVAVNPTCWKSSTNHIAEIQTHMHTHIYISWYNEFNPRFLQKYDRHCRTPFPNSTSIFFKEMRCTAEKG